MGKKVLVTHQLPGERIHALAQKSDQVSKGDITVEVHDDSRDSIGWLTRNFNEMIHNIRDRIEYANSLRLGISEPFFMVDADMRVTYMNEAAAKLGGVRVGEVQDKKTCEEVFNSDVCHTACAIKRAMETGEATVGQRVTMKDSSGKDIPIMVSGAALKDSLGNILGGFELIRDISKEVEAETVLRESYLKEEEAKKMLQGRVEALSGILQNAQVMQNRVLSDLEKNTLAADECGISFNAIKSYMKRRNVDSMIESIMESGKRASEVVDNMLTFSRKSGTSVERHNIVELLDKAVGLASSDYDLEKRYDFF